jgi:L-ascorbate metabolism protein UlaG (beta-lactamase superfamily)
MMKLRNLILALPLLVLSCKTETKKESTFTKAPSTINTAVASSFNVTPISHATMVLEWDGKIIYVDPVGGAEAFADQPKPDLILVTDIHGDHLNIETLQAIMQDNTYLIIPQAVADKLPQELSSKARILSNGETTNLRRLEGFAFEAIPMYNLREEALKFHEKGRGNGYVMQKDGKRVYISGDTEDIPEMRTLKNIEVAFVCMNLPYTMTIENAASAVLEFKPKTIYPYHYRGTEGKSDVVKFKSILNKGDAGIEVVQLDWYARE